MDPSTVEQMKTEVIAAIDAQNLRGPTWAEWAELTRQGDADACQAVNTMTAALLRERDEVDNALDLLAAEIPALKAAFEKKGTLQRIEFLCGAFLVSYRMTPKKRLEIRNAQRQQGGTEPCQVVD